MSPAIKSRVDAPGEFVQPIEAATGQVKGEPFVLNPREIFAADHPIVRAHPHLFRSVEQTRPAVESMTAAPGERRGAKGE